MVRFEVEKCLNNIQYRYCDQRVHAFAWRVATVIHLRQDVQIIVCPICLCQKERSEKIKPNQAGVLSCLNLILRTKRSKRSKRVAFGPKNKRNLHSIHSLWCHRLPRQFWLSASHQDIFKAKYGIISLRSWRRSPGTGEIWRVWWSFVKKINRWFKQHREVK